MLTIASRSAGTPGSGAYWLWPLRIAACAASSTAAGPSSSGKPCPRLMAPVCTANADISVKTEIPNPLRREAITPERYYWQRGSRVAAAPP